MKCLEPSARFPPAWRLRPLEGTWMKSERDAGNDWMRKLPPPADFTRSRWESVALSRHCSASGEARRRRRGPDGDRDSKSLLNCGLGIVAVGAPPPRPAPPNPTPPLCAAMSSVSGPSQPGRKNKRVLCVFVTFLFLHARSVLGGSGGSSPC